MATMDLKRSDRFTKPELLAPAGDLARAKLAIRYGADAVYLGGQSYSLRSRASNFTLEDIQEACAFAKQYGARIHVTVNMIPHQEDFEGLIDYVCISFFCNWLVCYKCGCGRISERSTAS